MTAHSPRRLVRRRFAAALAALAATTLAACGDDDGTSSSGMTELVVAEPGHSLGYLPLYVAIDEGYFEDEGLDVEVVTLQGGGAHTNAVLTGQAWAFIGGPEHNAFAAARDNSVTIKAISNVVNKGNVYLVAQPGADTSGDLRSVLDGKTIVTSAAGGTPHSITMYLLDQAGLKNGDDVTVTESADPSAALAIMQQDKADVAVVSEPILGQGVTQGIWDEPFYNVPQELGPYAYSTINVLEESYTEDPETVEAFIRAMQKGLTLVRDDKDRAVEIAKGQFPTLDEAVLEETIERALTDELWEWTGEVTPEAIETGLNIVRAAGILKDEGDPVQFEDIVDMSFWEEVGK